MRSRARIKMEIDSTKKWPARRRLIKLNEREAGKEKDEASRQRLGLIERNREAEKLLRLEDLCETKRRSTGQPT